MGSTFFLAPLGFMLVLKKSRRDVTHHLEYRHNNKYWYLIWRKGIHRSVLDLDWNCCSNYESTEVFRLLQAMF